MRFRLIDRVDALEPGVRATGRKAVSFEEYSLPRPGFTVGELPANLLLESIAQLGKWLVLASTDFDRAPLVVTIDRAELLSPLRAGEVAELEVRVRSLHDDAARFDGAARVNGPGPGDRRELARVDGVGCLLAPAASYFDLDDARAGLAALQGHYPGPADR